MTIFWKTEDGSPPRPVTIEAEVPVDRTKGACYPEIKDSEGDIYDTSRHMATAAEAWEQAAHELDLMEMFLADQIRQAETALAEQRDRAAELVKRRGTFVRARQTAERRR